jgi:hypothetical protein
MGMGNHHEATRYRLTACKEKKNQGLKFCLKELRMLEISCDGILILKLNRKSVFLFILQSY